MINNNYRVNNEFYVCPCLMKLLKIIKKLQFQV